MNSVATVPRTTEISPRTKARMAGGFFLATILTGVFTQQFISHLVVSGDAAATAANILSHESVFRLGFAVYLVELACQITMTTLMYDLLKPVSRSGPPRPKARMAVVFYLATILTGVFTQQFISHLVVSGDAAATASPET